MAERIPQRVDAPGRPSGIGWKRETMVAAERHGDFLVLRDLAGCRRALRVTDTSEVRDHDDACMEAAVVTRRGEAVVLLEDFDVVLPLVLARWDRR